MVEQKQVATFINGKTISLVAPSIEYLDLYVKWDNDPDFRHVSRNLFPVSVQAYKKFFEKSKPNPPNEILLNIWHKKDKKIIGHVGFDHIHWADATASVGLLIGEKNYWGKGIGTEAVALLLDYGFNELHFFKITGEMFHINVASWRVAEKVGMYRELKLKKQAYVKGEYVDEYHYYIFREEWKKKRKKFDFLKAKHEEKKGE